MLVWTSGMVRSLWTFFTASRDSLDRSNTLIVVSGKMPRWEIPWIISKTNAVELCDLSVLYWTWAHGVATMLFPEIRQWIKAPSLLHYKMGRTHTRISDQIFIQALFLRSRGCHRCQRKRKTSKNLNLLVWCAVFQPELKKHQKTIKPTRKCSFFGIFSKFV